MHTPNLLFYEQRIYRILNEQMINHLVIKFIQIAKQSFVFFVKFVVCAYTPPAVYEQRIYRILNEQMINHLVIRFIQIAKQSFVFFVKFVVCITLFVVIVQSELLHLHLCACIFLIVIIEIIANFHNIHTIKKIRKPTITITILQLILDTHAMK